MKNSFRFIGVVVLIFWFAVLSIACSTGDNGGDNPNGGANTLKIKGKFLDGSQAKGSWMNGLLAKIYTSAFAQNANNQVDKVIAVESWGKSPFHVNVENGTFQLNVDVNRPIGLVFVDSNNQPVGHLSLGKGIDILPLTKIEEGISEIDLRTITISSGVGTPSHNPIGSEILLTEDEQSALADFDNFFAVAVKNLDMDGNGTVDYFEGRRYMLQMLFEIGRGITGLDASDPSAATIDIWKPIFGVNDSVAVSPLPTFTVPSNPVPVKLVPEFFFENLDHTVYFFGGGGASGNPALPAPNPSGDYTVSYKDRTIIFKNVVSYNEDSLLIPHDIKFFSKGGGLLGRMTCAWKLKNGASIDPTTIIEQVRIGGAFTTVRFIGGNTWEYTPTSDVRANASSPFSNSQPIEYRDLFQSQFIFYFNNIPIIEE